MTFLGQASIETAYKGQRLGPKEKVSLCPSRTRASVAQVEKEKTWRLSSKMLKHRREACAQVAEPGLRNRLDLMENPSPLKAFQEN